MQISIFFLLSLLASPIITLSPSTPVHMEAQTQENQPTWAQGQLRSMMSFLLFGLDQIPFSGNMKNHIQNGFWLCQLLASVVTRVPQRESWTESKAIADKVKSLGKIRWSRHGIRYREGDEKVYKETKRKWKKLKKSLTVNHCRIGPHRFRI